MRSQDGRALDLYYEDINIGEELTTRSHKLTTDDILKFADVTLDHHPLHTDEEYCKSTQFGRPIAHGLFGLSLMEGLKSEIKMYEHTSIASMGWNNVRFKAPVFSGDEVHVKVVFTKKRPSSKPGKGIVTEQVLLINQHGDIVTEAEHVSMIMMRHPEEKSS